MRRRAVPALLVSSGDSAGETPAGLMGETPMPLTTGTASYSSS
jgi:hypothetical protein